MGFWVVGLSHKTAPLEIRERAAILPHRCFDATQDLLAKTSACEAMIVSTCNRTELYFIQDDNAAEVTQWLHTYLGLADAFLESHCYVYRDAEALTHIMSVASGLDSMMIGEPQIFGQMKEAYQQAISFGSLGSELNRLMQYVFGACKAVRAHTEIGQKPISVASVAVRLVAEHYNELAGIRVLLIGSGETITACARYLVDAGVAHMAIANRSLEHAQALAAEVGAKAISINDIPLHVGGSDLVISATACPYPILTYDTMQVVAAQQSKRVLIDLAVPRDIEANVAELDGVKLYCIDDLTSQIDNNLALRSKAQMAANELITERVADYQQWTRSLDAVETIKAYRERIEAMRKAEVSLALRQIESGQDIEKVIKRLSNNLANKFLHVPTARLREANELGEMNLLSAATHLFDLDTTTH